VTGIFILLWESTFRCVRRIAKSDC